MDRSNRIVVRLGRMLCACHVVVAGLDAPAQTTLLTDDFNDGAINTALWTISLPFPASSVTEPDGSLELFRRGVLSADGSFAGDLDIQGRFRFVGDNDTLSVVFRSDLAVANQAERRGVQAAFQESSGKVFLIPEPFASNSPPIPAPFNIGKNRDVTFRLTDNGDTVQLYLEDLFRPLLSVTITNRRGARICLYNFYDTPCRARVDSFAVYPLRTSVFIDNTLVREGPVQKSAAVQVKLQAFLTNSTVFYTLDGTVPSFVSTEYRGPITLESSAVIRAIAYRSDFAESSESPTIEVQLLPQVVLTNGTPGGGTVTTEPPGNAYASNTVVTLTAIPAPGWQFLRWEGAVSGSLATNSVTMTNHLTIRAVFGTTAALSSLPPGSGHIQTYPAGSLFEYGTKVRLMAVPASGSYFFRWANAVTGNLSPATLQITNGNPGVAALFDVLGGGQVSLIALVEGSGTLTGAPAGNVFTNGRPITLTALPDTDQVFLGWSGDLTGGASPASLVMDGNKTVTATFAAGVRFLESRSSFGTNGFLLTMKGVPGFVFDLEASSDLASWNRLETLTNLSGLLNYQHWAATNQPWRFYRVVAP